VLNLIVLVDPQVEPGEGSPAAMATWSPDHLFNPSVTETPSDCESVTGPFSLRPDEHEAAIHITFEDVTFTHV
jgi:hypothetical protein